MIADSEKLFSSLVNTTASWPEQLKRKVKFMMHDVWYPPVGHYIQTLRRNSLLLSSPSPSPKSQIQSPKSRAEERDWVWADSIIPRPTSQTQAKLILTEFQGLTLSTPSLVI